MHGDGDYEVDIPSMFIGKSTWESLDENYIFNVTVDPEERAFVVMVGEDDSIINYLLPFSLIIAVCLTTMMVFSLVRLVRQWRRTRKARLTRRKLKKLPKKKFDKETDHWENCAICIEDYENGDNLRILPCNHAFHVDCVDPWLTRSRRTCPLCKSSVLSSEDEETESQRALINQTASISDQELEHEETTSLNNGLIDDDDEQPLLSDP